MNRIVLDGRPLQGDSGSRGIGTYLRGLLEGMAEVGVADQLGLLLARTGDLPAAPGRGRLPTVARVPRLERRMQVLADPFLVAAALRRCRPRLYHAVEYGQPWRAATPVVVTVHDLIPFLLPGYSWRSKLLRRGGLRLLARADGVVAPSEATARDCVRIAGVDPGRIHVVAHGVSPRYRPASPEQVAELRGRLRLPQAYLLGVGTFELRKGLGHLIAVTRELRRAHDLDLVIAGHQGLFEATVEKALAPLGDHGRNLGFVSLDDLIALYTGAAAYVFPTAYEGFGLPLLEAMACGGVAVAFDNSSLPEVAGDAAVLVPDGDVHALATAIDRLLRNPAEVAWRRRRGIERAAGFTWRRAAQRTVAVYEEVLGEALLRS